MTKSLICIACPRGCRLTVISCEGSAELEVSGNNCPKGVAYAEQEVLCPMRTLTTTVACRTVQSTGCSRNTFRMTRLPVKTDCEIPLKDMMTVIRQIHTLTADAPIHHGDCIARIDTDHGTVIPVVACASTEI